MPRTTIRSEDITAAQVKSADMADDAITADKILADSITTVKILNDNVTLAKMADGTQGGTIYYGASGAPTELAAGTSGQFLKTQGTSANPVWGTVASSGFHNVNFVTATDTSVDLTSGTTLIVVEVQGAGGCAAGSNGPGAYGGCGAAGGYSMQQLTVVDTDTWNITIGAGGTEAGTRAGGDAVFAQASGSSLSSTITAVGGGAGNNPPGGSGSHQAGGIGGTVTNANTGAFNMTGSDGSAGGLDKVGPGSRWGWGGARQVAGAGAGGNASGYGAGGGDANGASQNGGDGSDALVVIWEYK